MSNICNGLGKQIKTSSALTQKRRRDTVVHNTNEWISHMHEKAALQACKNHKNTIILNLLIGNWKKSLHYGAREWSEGLKCERCALALS
jgi:hypothetical protein